MIPPFRPLLLGLTLAAVSATTHAADYVIQISVDGLGSSYLQSLISLGEAPNFERLLTEGSGTLNARADYDYTITLPNHTSMLTGRPVQNKFGDATSGHLWTENYELDPPLTLHENRGFYLSSTFDVAHDHGLATALYSGKPKFSLYEDSYDADSGAMDLIGPDNGRAKIDTTRITDFDSDALMTSFLSDMQAAPTNYTFLHFHDPDSAGHSGGWGSANYLAAIQAVDDYLGSIFDLVALQPQLAGRTAIVLTADHGGGDDDHGDPTLPLDYTIPFLVWGSGIAGGGDLYGLNPSTRLDPGTDRPDYSTEIPPPIRNGDAGNLALDLLGLGAIPGSSINSNQDLSPVPEPSLWGAMVGAGLLTLAFRRRMS